MAGRSFVGPAGALLDKALAEAGIDRSDVYVTNVVKHFKWVPSERGKRRIHRKPSYAEIQVCPSWLDAEPSVVKPEILVCLAAAQALLWQGLQGKSSSRIGGVHAYPLRPSHSAPTSVLSAMMTSPVAPNSLRLLKT